MSSKKRQYSKEAIEKAIEFIENNEGSIRKAAKIFGVPRSSIQFKLQNPNTKFKSGPNPVLTEAEENELCNFILQQAKRGFPRKKEDIKVCVQDFLKKNPRPTPFLNDKPGDVWFKAFLKRHPNITFRTSEGVTNASACVSEADIRKWFHEIQEYIECEGLSDVIQDPTRVFNADESGFNVCPKTGKVLAEKGCRNVYEIEKASAKENITVLFTFSAAGQVYNPMVIYPYKRIPDRVTMSVPSGWGIGRSDSGWMTAAVFYDYIGNCFDKELTSNNVPRPVIMFVDGHKTHITLEVSELCRTLHIHLIALYPNATRILQPADVAAFRPIKIGWKKMLRDWYIACNYKESLTKECFAPLLKKVVDSYAKKETLINGFRVSGLYPFDPDNVDYSKCIPTKQPINSPEPIRINTIDNESVLTYSDFCGVVGETIILKCQTTTSLTLVDSDENFIAIYKLWKKFRSISEDNINNDLANQDSNENLQTDERNLLMEDSCATHLKEQSEDYRMILNEYTGELMMSNTDKSYKMQDKEVKEIEECTLKETPTYLTDFNTPISSVILTPVEKPQLFSLNNINDPQPATSKLIETQLTSSVNEPQPSTSKQMDSNKTVSIISNIPFSEYLKQKLPDSPKRQGKRQIEKYPFALTSNEYVQMIKAKQLKKEEEAAAKEERKRLREAKKNQKENNVPNKKPKNEANKTVKRKIMNILPESTKVLENKKKQYFVCCDYCLNPITKKVISCSSCKKQFHHNCIPASHRIHIPEDDCDSFLCHNCYRESNTSSDDDDVRNIFEAVINHDKY